MKLREEKDPVRWAQEESTQCLAAWPKCIYIICPCLRQLYSTEHFPILEHQDPALNEFGIVQKRRSPDIEALKLFDDRSGSLYGILCAMLFHHNSNRGPSTLLPVRQG